MKKRSGLIGLMGLLSLFLLSGCVQFVQEMTVKEDGSGSISFALGVESDAYEEFQEDIPEGYELENLFSRLMQEAYVTDFTQDHYEEDGWTWDSIQLDVADFSAVFVEEDLEIGPLIMELDETEEGYTYRQMVNLAGSTLNIPGINLMDLSEASYTVRLDVPQITSTDGVQEAAGVSVWEVTLSSVLQEGDDISMVADYVMTPFEGYFIPWDTFFSELMFGFLALGILVILVVIIVNTTGKRNTGRK